MLVIYMGNIAALRLEVCTIYLVSFMNKLVHTLLFLVKLVLCLLCCLKVVFLNLSCNFLTEDFKCINKFFEALFLCETLF